MFPSWCIPPKTLGGWRLRNLVASKLCFPNGWTLRHGMVCTREKDGLYKGKITTLPCTVFFSLPSWSTPKFGCSFCDQRTVFGLVRPVLCCALVVQQCWKSRLATSPPCRMTSPAMHRHPAAVLWSERICIAWGGHVGLIRGCSEGPWHNQAVEPNIKRVWDAHVPTHTLWFRSNNSALSLWQQGKDRWKLKLPFKNMLQELQFPRRRYFNEKFPENTRGKNLRA